MSRGTDRGANPGQGLDPSAMRLPERVEVLAIGDELLDGRVADTNTLRLARALSEVGVAVAQRTTVTDDGDAIVEQANAVAARGCDLCVVSGGLGPTTDDLTSEAFADLLGVDLVRDEPTAQRITERLQRRGRAVTANQLKQADRPRGAALVANHNGTAAGFALHHGGCRFVVVPGVPKEFDAMVEAAVVGPLRAVATAVPLQHSFRSFGLVEGDADTRLRQALGAWPEVRVGYRARFPEIHVTLRASQEASAAFCEAVEAARDALGAAVFTEQQTPFAQVVVEALRGRGSTLALAESCTGGLVSDMVTDVPGSSEVFLLGVVAYANAAKQSLLGVRAETLQAHGAVSEPTAIEMAVGVRRRAGATYGLATTGIAGPGGGSPDKPVGTVWTALSEPGGTSAKKLTFPFDRRGNKVVTAYAVLDRLRRRL